MNVLVAEVKVALATLADAITRNASATCPECGHQPPSARVEAATAELIRAIKEAGR